MILRGHGSLIQEACSGRKYLSRIAAGVRIASEIWGEGGVGSTGFDWVRLGSDGFGSVWWKVVPWVRIGSDGFGFALLDFGRRSQEKVFESKKKGMGFIGGIKRKT
jgi:hypothetical protein